MTPNQAMPSDNFRQETIATFRSVTAVKSDDEAIRHLQASAWDLERAANRYFSGETDPPSSTSPNTADPSSSTPSTATAPTEQPIQPSQTVQPVSSSPISTVTTNHNRRARSVQTRTPRWLLVITPPLRFLWSIISSITNTIMQVLGGPARAIEAAPGATPSQRFLNFFESRYGHIHPNLFDGGYLSALSAAHTQTRFLLVYLHSEGHRLTPSFCEDVFSNSEFITAANDICIVWAGSVTQRDGAAVYHNLRVPALPFLAVVAAPTRPTTTDLSRADFGTVLAIRAGPSVTSGGGEAAAAWLQRVVRRHNPMLESIRQQRAERESARLLIEQQNEEYAAALAADRKREKEAEEEQKKEEMEKQRLEELEVRRLRKNEALGTEPEKGPGIASIVLKLPDGSRVGRRFCKSDVMEKVFDWAEVNRMDIESACLVVSYPRKKFRYPEDGDITLEQAGLFPSCILMLEERDDEQE